MTFVPPLLFFRFDPFNIILCHIHLKSSRLDRNSPFIEFMTMCFYLGALVCVLQETGGVGGGQQPDRGDLPDPAATANHLFPPSPPLADQRLCQSGTESHTIRHRSSCIITVLRLFMCVCVVRWWAWSVPPAWPMGFLFSTWAPTSRLRCPSAQQWSDWSPCRSR